MGFFDSLQHGAQDFAPMALPFIGAGAGYYFGGPMGGMIGASAGSQIGAMFQNYQNFGFQENLLKYQKKLQKQMFDREDNAIYRRVADLRAAGLSPVLAAGQGASAGSVVSTKAPQIGEMPNTALTVMSMLKMKADIDATNAQKALTAKQYEKEDWNLQWYKNEGQPTNMSGIAKDISQLTKGIQNMLEGTNTPGKILNNTLKAPFWDQILKTITPERILQEERNKQIDDLEKQRLQRK